MSKTSNIESAIGKLLTYLLILLLVLGLAGVVVYFVAKDEGVSFYVEYGGERYFSGVNEADLCLFNGETYSFSVKPLIGDNVDYSVSVSSNGEHNFAFIYDGEFYDFYVKDDTENNDYSEVFGLQKNKGGFSITLPKDFSVKQAIETKYGGDIQLQKELQGNVPYFVITIMSGEDSLRLWFVFISLTITLDPPSIIF